jgi:hypothetical protein
VRLRLEGERVTEEEELLKEFGWRIRDVRVGPDGYLYVLPDAWGARILRLTPADSLLLQSSQSSEGAPENRGEPRVPGVLDPSAG